MERVFTAKAWNFLAWAIIVIGTVFAFADMLLWVQQAGWQDIRKALLLEGLLTLALLMILFVNLSEKIILTEQSLTQIYRSVLFFKVHRRSVEWKDITKIEGEFGFFHIGDRITLHLSRDKFSTYDIIQERDRITITNVLTNFDDLVVEITMRASAATVAESVKKFVSRYESVER